MKGSPVKFPLNQFWECLDFMRLWTSKVWIEHYSNEMLYSDLEGTNACEHSHSLTYQGFEMFSST